MNRFLLVALCAMGLISSGGYAQSKEGDALSIINADDSSVLKPKLAIAMEVGEPLATPRISLNESCAKLVCGADGNCVFRKDGLDDRMKMSGLPANTLAPPNPLKVTRKNPLDCDNTTCMFLNAKGEVEYHFAETLTRSKPTEKDIKAWANPGGVCPSDWFTMYMERLGYPHRKDCDKPRRKALIEHYVGIDTGGPNSPYRSMRSKRRK